jgi:signal transduction histidine kinase
MFSDSDYHTIFHELKNSLTILNSSLQLVEKEQPSLISLDFWNSSKQELYYMQSLLAELSYVRPFEAIKRKPVDFSVFLTNLSHTFEGIAKIEQFSFQTNCPDNMPATIYADAFYLKLALTNLLKNAYEAMMGNGTLLLKVSCHDTDLILDVIDSGSGIPHEQVNELFTLFYTTKPTGSGLGLPIAKHLIEGHHGTLSLVRNDASGCTFRVFLPDIIQK